MWPYNASTMRPEQFNIYPRPVHNSHNPFANCSFRNWFNKLINNALVSPRLHLVQGKYIFRGVITKMRDQKDMSV